MPCFRRVPYIDGTQSQGSSLMLQHCLLVRTWVPTVRMLCCVCHAVVCSRPVEKVSVVLTVRDQASPALPLCCCSIEWPSAVAAQQTASESAQSHSQVAEAALPQP